MVGQGGEVTPELVKVDLSVEAAEKLTADIESGFSRVAGNVEKLVRMLTTASELRAWAVLGYEGWEAYVKDRFDGSRSRLWRAIDQAQVTMELAAAAGVKPVELEDAVSGRAAQEIKDQLPEVKAAVESATKGQPKAKRPAIVKDTVDQARVARAQTDEQGKRPATFASTTEEIKTYSFWFDPDADLGKKILAASKKAKMPAYDWVILAVREKLSAAEEEAEQAKKGDVKKGAAVGRGPAPRNPPPPARTERQHALNCSCLVCKPPKGTK
jgi:hypothetical protein